MATYTKKSTSAADAARLNLLEEKVRNLTPGEGAPPDIAQALDRLYDMTMRGGMHSSEDVTADMVDGMFWFRQQSLASAEKKSTANSQPRHSALRSSRYAGIKEWSSRWRRRAMSTTASFSIGAPGLVVALYC
ncbi:hypothetical protein ACC685_34460 [Rhizobium ruizarguesonis]